MNELLEVPMIKMNESLEINKNKQFKNHETAGISLDELEMTLENKALSDHVLS